MTSSLIIFPSGLMSDKSDLPIEEEYERNLAYTPPAQKSLEEIQEMDKDDESLVKYKQTLLGSLQVNAGVFAFGFKGHNTENRFILHLPQFLASRQPQEQQQSSPPDLFTPSIPPSLLHTHIRSHANLLASAPLTPAALAVTADISKVAVTPPAAATQRGLICISLQWRKRGRGEEKQGGVKVEAGEGLKNGQWAFLLRNMPMILSE